VNLLEPVAIALGELLVLHAEPPVGVPSREAAERSDLGELVVVEHLEDRVVEVQAELARMLLGLDLQRPQLGRELVLVAHDRHGRSPRSVQDGRLPQALVRNLRTSCSMRWTLTSQGFLSSSISSWPAPSSARYEPANAPIGVDPSNVPRAAVPS